MTTIWRYVYAPRSKLCMYAGELLDNYVLFIRRYYKSPKFLIISNKYKDYVITAIFVQFQAITFKLVLEGRTKDSANH